MLPIWIFWMSCEEAIELSAEEFIESDFNVAATALAGDLAGDQQQKRGAKKLRKSLKILDEILKTKHGR